MTKLVFCAVSSTGRGAKFLLPCLVSCHLVHLVFNMISTSRGAKVHSMTMVICTSREAKFPVSSMTKVVFCAVSSTGRGGPSSSYPAW